MNYIGEDLNKEKTQECDFADLNPDLKKMLTNKKLIFCITCYNESFELIMLSLAGVYRNYYELVEKDISYKDKVSVVIVFDGYEVFNKSANPRTNKRLAETFYEIGLYDEKETAKFYKKIPKEKDKVKYFEYEFSELKFMDLNNDKEEKKEEEKKEEEKRDDRSVSYQADIEAAESQRISFETNNLAHVFSAKLTFDDFVRGLTDEEKGEFKIDRYDFNDFMLGSSKQGKI